MSTYEIERDDKVVVFHESNTYSQLENFMSEYRINHPDQSMVVYCLDDDMNRIGEPANFKSSMDDPNLRTDVNTRANMLFESLPIELQEAMMDIDHNCDQCSSFDECSLPYKDDWIR